MSEQIGIYKIESPSGKCYVGMTTDSFRSRWNSHLRDLRANRHKCRGLQRAFLKYGEDSLDFSVLEVMDADSTDLAVFQRECDWWDELTENGVVLYNGRPTGTGSVHHTAETRQRISSSLRIHSRGSAEGERRTLSKVCPECTNSYSVFLTHSDQIFCSKECAALSQIRVERQKVVAFYADGLSLRKVAAQVGISHIAVRKILIKAKVPLRSR